MATPAYRETNNRLAAERAIKPLTVQRKNSLFFGSTKGALNSAVYNTFIETCKQVGVSFRDYFRAVLKELGSGREDETCSMSLVLFQTGTCAAGRVVEIFILMNKGF